MIFCPKCGGQNHDAAKFCRDCGSPISGAPQPQSAPVRPAPFTSGNGVLDTVHTLVGSPLFLVGAIACSLTVFFNFIQLFQSNPFNSMLSLSYLLPESSSAFYSMYSTGSGVYILLSLLMLIPAILVLTGIWITFITSKTSQDRRPSTVGLTIIRVITIIRLVLLCIAIFIVEIVCIILAIASSQVRTYSYGYSSSAGIGTGLIILLMFLIAGIAVFYILYYIKLFKTVGEMIQTIQTAVPSDRISAYVAVISIIGGVGSVIWTLFSSVILSSVAHSLYLSAGSTLNVLSILGDLCSAATAIAFGIFLFSYRNKMQMCMTGMPDPHSEYAPTPEVRYQTPNYNAEPVSPVFPSSPPKPADEMQDLDETQAFISPDHTVLLNPGDSYESVRHTIYPYLLHQKTGSKIPINKPEFWLGSDPSKTDYPVLNNPTVSRRHAQLTIQNGSFYIVDNFSTNHVYVNNQLIQPGSPVLLQDNSRIQLSDEIFIFRIDRE